MKPSKLETQRLIIRDLDLTDKNDLFEMDSDPMVHRYIDNNPVNDLQEITEAISYIRRQYKSNGIGRWALELKNNGEVIGWAGLKFIESMNGHQNFYELGYRLKQKHWNKGYASEACRAIVDYGFSIMDLNVIYA